MGLVLGPQWAIAFYRRTSDAQVGKLLRSAGHVDEDEVVCALAHRPLAQEARDLLDWYPEVFCGRIPVYVGDSRYRNRPRNFECMVAAAKFPQGSFGRLPSGDFCLLPAPALAASSLRLPRCLVLELACEFCGSYRKDSRDQRGMVDRDPLLSKSELGSYVERGEGLRGIKAARRLVPFVAEGSGSPMETALYVLLCMDVQAGGAGLPKPELNGVVELAPAQQAATGRSYVKVDLLWREKKVAVEYDSDWAHGNPYALNRDATKRNALQELGYRVVSVTKDQVFDWPRFQGLSLMLAGLLGKDSSRAARDWTEKRFEVWTTLTRRKRFEI